MSPACQPAATAPIVSQTWQAIRQMPPGDLQRVVGEREQPEAMVAEPAQGRGDLGMRWHGGEPVGELGRVGVTDLDAAGRGVSFAGPHPQ